MEKTINSYDPTFENLLNYIKHSRGFDFNAYKRTSLMRRIQKRMQTVNAESFDDYTDYLKVHPNEFGILFDTILINVTSFFRDSATWDYIEKVIIPAIIARKKSTDPIRIWSAGCASGEEAYTIAILLAEALGIDKFRERVKIYASDLDEGALNQARQATYNSREIDGLPAEMVAKYFEHSDHRYMFRKDLRRSVIFGRHDLVQDAPISRIDLLICRNVLMYFNAEAQTKILSHFHFALNETGYLFLGKAEMLFTHTNLFTPDDLKRRVFTKVSKVGLRDRLTTLARNSNDDTNSQLSKYMRFREAAFDASPVAQIVIDLNGFLALMNERARTLLGLHTVDFGRTVQDLEFAYRIPELKSGIEQVFSEKRASTLREIDWATPSGDTHTLEIHLSPLFDSGNTLLGAAINFTDITRAKRLQDEIEHSNQELETAYEELQSSNEELETTNEELQSTVEELETTNEELQSTNEELETMNEELQSTNEELQTINEEIRRRTDELNQVNSFMESILTSMRGGVVVVNRDLLVQVWNQRAEDLWGLRASEVLDKNFLNLDMGLPVEQLKKAVRACLLKEETDHEIVLSATNRRGKSIQCRVTCTPLLDSQGIEPRGVILVMEEIDPL